MRLPWGWWRGYEQIAIAYEEINHVKLYHPGSKEFKFQYRGSKPHDYVFGQTRIIRNMRKTGSWKRDNLIIAAGEKDTMTLAALGYDAICLNSETATSIPPQLEESIINNYRNIISKLCAETVVNFDHNIHSAPYFLLEDFLQVVCNINFIT